MIIFLFGQDSYRLKQNLDKIIGEYKNKYSGLGYSFLDFSEPKQLTLLEDTIKTVSFFDEKRLVVIKNVFSEADRVAELIKTWDLANDKQRIVVFVENMSEAELTKKNKKFFDVLTLKTSMVKSLKPISGSKLELWLAKEIRTIGYEIEKNALYKLINYTLDRNQKGSDPSVSWRLKQEVDKLINYKFTTDSKLINEKDIDLLVMPRVDLNVFQVVDAIASKNKPLALTLLHQHIESGVDPYYIFSMVVYQFRNLLRVKSLIKNAVPYPDIIKKTGLNPFVVKKTYEQSRKFDLEELKKLFNNLTLIESASKNGEAEMADGLFQLVFSLSS